MRVCLRRQVLHLKDTHVKRLQACPSQAACGASILWKWKSLYKVIFKKRPFSRWVNSSLVLPRGEFCACNSYLACLECSAALALSVAVMGVE